MVTRLVIKQGYVNGSIKNDSLVHEKYHEKLKTEKSGINIW